MSAPLPSLSDAAKALGGEVAGLDTILCPGPSHGAHDRSLSVKLFGSNDFVVHSFAGDDAIVCRDHVRARLGMPPWRSHQVSTDHQVAAAKPGNGSLDYVYRTADGTPHIRVRRFERPDGKTFRQERWDGERWAQGLNGAERILYCLPTLMFGDQTATIFIVEGEKCADALAEIGLVATTNLMGAGKWCDAYSQVLTGRCVAILPDNDEPGRRHAEAVAQSVAKVAASVKVLELPGLPPKGDVVDWLAAGGTEGGLARLVEGAPAWKAGDALASGPTPYRRRDPKSIPPRDWLMGTFLQRGKLAETVAPGGAGKTMLTIAESLAMATGRTLLHDKIKAPLRVWLWNLEEDSEELARRIEGACKYFQIDAELDGLFVDSGFDRPLCVAETNRDGFTILRPVTNAIIADLKRQRVDVLIVDPFVSSHRVPENDNVAIDKVAREWARIARETGCAVHLVHHVHKMGGMEVTAESSRGAKALVDAARSVRTINKMPAATADEFGLAEAWRYVRIDSAAKANNAPPAEAATWCAMASVELGNGDSVGVMKPFRLPNAMDSVTVAHLDEVVRRVGDGHWRESHRAAEWVGNLIADVIGADLDVPADRKRVKTALKAWLKSGALRVVIRKDASRHERKYVVPGTQTEINR